MICCSAPATAPHILRRCRDATLCAGGAGFVSALVGTLVGSGRTAQAQTLSVPIPEVDRLRIRIVVDIVARRYATSQKLDDLTVQRLQGNETPDAPPRATLVGEWGLSMHAESQRGGELRNVLIDFGYNPATLLNNLDILKIAPESFDATVLSHGHYDHFGGIGGIR